MIQIRKLLSLATLAVALIFTSQPAVAAGVTDYTENKLVDHILRGTAWTAPTTVCWGLLTAAPNDASTGATVTEATYTGYARGQLNPSVSNYKSTNGATSGASTGTSGASTNAAIITFGTAATSGPTVVTHFGVFDSCTAGAGNLMFYGTLSASKTINNGDPAPTAPVDAMSITVTD